MATIVEYRPLLRLFLEKSAKSYKLAALWNFNMGVNGKILKCAVSWEKLSVKQKEKNLDPV